MRLFCLTLFHLALLLSLTGMSHAQFDRSALTGAVQDQNGAAVPGVIVRVVQPATGLSRQTITSADGVYAVPGLPVGMFVVTFTKPGFKTIRIDDVSLTVGLTRTLNAKLMVAETSEEVTI